MSVPVCPQAPTKDANQFLATRIKAAQEAMVIVAGIADGIKKDIGVALGVEEGDGRAEMFHAKNSVVEPGYYGNVVRFNFRRQIKSFSTTTGKEATIDYCVEVRMPVGPV